MRRPGTARRATALAALALLTLLAGGAEVAKAGSTMVFLTAPAAGADEGGDADTVTLGAEVHQTDQLFIGPVATTLRFHVWQAGEPEHSAPSVASFPVEAVANSIQAFEYAWTPPSDGTWFVEARAATIIFGNLQGPSVESGERSFTVDQTGPVSTVDEPLEGSTVAGETTISVIAADANSVVGIRVLGPDDEELVGTSQTTCCLYGIWNTTAHPDGPFQFRIEATDELGNISVSDPVSVTIDNAGAPPPPDGAPDVSWVSPPDGSTILHLGTFDFQVDAPAGVATAQCQFESGALFTDAQDQGDGVYRCQLHLFSLDGTIGIRLRVVDGDGGVGYSELRHFPIDSDTPAITIYHPNGAYVRDVVEIRADAAAANGLQRVRITVDDDVRCDPCTTGMHGDYREMWPTSDWEGQTVDIVATAWGQNGTSASDTQTVTIDNVRPTMSVLSEPSEVVSGVASYTVGGTDAASPTLIVRVFHQSFGTLANVTVPSGGEAELTFNTLAKLPDGVHTVRFEARDEAGNVSTPVLTRTIQVLNGEDDVAPRVDIDEVSLGGIRSWSAGFGAWVEEDVGIQRIECSVDGDLFGYGQTWSPPTGNPPNASCAWQHALHPLASGPHVFRMTVVDLAGNTAFDEGTMMLDTDAPVVTIESPAPGTVVDGTVTIEGRAEDNMLGVARVDLYLDGDFVDFRDVTQLGPDGSFAFDWDATVAAPGVYAFSVVGVDSGFNEGVAATLELIVDGPPSVTLTSPLAGATVTGVVSLAAQASDPVGVAEVTFFVDGTSVGSDTAAPYAVSWSSTDVAEGSHTIAATVEDTTGDTAASSPVTVTVVHPTPPAPAPGPSEPTPQGPTGPVAPEQPQPGPSEPGPGKPEGMQLVGTPRADRLTGGAGDDTIRGLAGNDLLRGLRGDDLIAAGAGNDRIQGGLGGDVLRGGPGADRLASADGERDVVDCGAGRDSLVADRLDRVRDCERVIRRDVPEPTAASRQASSVPARTLPPWTPARPSTASSSTAGSRRGPRSRTAPTWPTSRAGSTRGG